MKCLSRRISHRRPAAVPHGHLPLCVGDDMDRFVVSADLLNHPIFAALLDRSAREYGYEQQGVLRIPCHALLFRRVVEALAAGDPRRAKALLDSIPDEA